MGLVNYVTYLKEASVSDFYVNLYLSTRFISAIYKMRNNNISRKFEDMILNLGTGKCNQKFDISFVDVTDKPDTVSYITSAKAKPILDKYISINKEKDGINLCWITHRQEQKISRFINRIFPSLFSQSEIENFVKEYKVALLKDDVSKNFEIVKGKDVTKYYNENYSNQDTRGQLQKSCMRKSECEYYFQIFEDNPDKMNMLILKDEYGTIYGRANIWYLDRPSDKIFMDRIYTTYDWQVKLFIDYAIKNDYIYKSKQIYGGSVIPVIVDGRSEKITMTVNLKPKSYEYYPYVDTLQFYNPNDGTLTSDVKKFDDPNYLVLVFANGGYFNKMGDTHGIDYLGRIVHRGNLVWSEYDNVLIHVNDAINLAYRNDYATPEHEFIKIGGRIYLKEDVDIDEETGEHIIKDEF